MPRIPRFEKGSPEAKAFMSEVREKARINREAIAKGELEPIDKPKKVKKAKKVKEEIVFKTKEEEVVVSEPEEEEEEQEVEAPPPPPPKKVVKKVKIEPVPEPEPEPEPEPVKKVQKVVKPVKVVEEKAVIIKAPAKKIKKIIIQEEEPQYEIEYRKAIPLKKQPIEKKVIENIKDTQLDNPLLGSRVYRNR